jgi:ABC-type dipeptide/oligopeptide/nickel transport system permease component
MTSYPSAGSSTPFSFLGITVATFTLIHSVPGDPISFYAGAVESRRSRRR